jgi:hypothetical protein
MIDTVAWLQISDFHFIAEGDDFSQRIAARALLDDVPARIRSGMAPGFRARRGGIAQSGQPGAVRARSRVP